MPHARRKIRPAHNGLRDVCFVDGFGLLRQHQAVQPFKAIAAMSLNRVIGAGNQIPWHLPEDFKWFKKMTTGQVVLMGRKTFESIGKPLPNRTTLVLTRGTIPVDGVLTISDLTQIDRSHPALAGREIFVCGGAQLYGLALPLCSDLYLTLVQRVVEGDTFFPRFEDQFELAATLAEYPGFKILHYHRA
jgi:dihydrofolate reductase